MLSTYFNKVEMIHYPAFGIDLPINYSIHGIDVSHHQNNINWTAVNAMEDQDVSLRFVFIKATEGLNDVDENFIQNWYGSRQTNMIRGAYHFFIGNKSGKAQAANFIRTVPLKKGDFPPVLDVEQVNGATIEEMRQNMQEWLTTTEEFYHVKPIIYTYVDFYEKYLIHVFNDYPLWIAHYQAQGKPKVQRNWLFWQHNEKGRVNGIGTDVDFNVFNGDSNDLKDILIH